MGPLIVVAALILGGVGGFQLVNQTYGRRKREQIRKRKEEYRANPVNAWHNNLKNTPLSSTEMSQIARKVLLAYQQWQMSSLMNHFWLCIEIGEDAIYIRRLYSDAAKNRIAIPQAITYAYSHNISSQKDREMLADAILSAIRREHPQCALYLDGDSLILPTNG